MRPLKYSKEAINLIAERMPNAFLKQFVLLYLGTEMSLEQCAERLNYSKKANGKIFIKGQRTYQANA